MKDLKISLVVKSSIKRFEDLEIWKSAQDIIVQIYEISNKKQIAGDFEFRNQIRRAALSIANNIAEGFERGSNAGFVNFLYYSKGSFGEVRSMIQTAFSLHYINSKEMTQIKNVIIDQDAHTINFIKYLNKTKKKIR